MAANVQSMVQYWKDFDLPQLQRELDVAATELANRQDESDSSRKKLVELSREFKKTTPEDIRKVVAPLLKSFQAEIDNLSKRSKAAEAAFLNVYKKLIDVPDPMPVLEYCNATQQRVQRLQDLELENRQLRETLNDYNQEFKEVKNQEVTIKQLREKLKEYEERLEAAAMARAKEKEKELQRQFSDKERHLQESQLVVAKKLGDAEQRVTSLQSALESTQSELFDLKSKYDEDSHAKSDEMEMIMNDLERANQRASLAEKEVAQLKEQLVAATQSLQLADQIQKAPDMEQAIDILTRSSLEVELAAKEKEESELLTKKNQQISQLLDDVQRLQSTINTMKETSAAQIAKLEALLEEKSRFIRELEEKLNAHKDYDEMKRELSILKSIEFPAALVAEVAATHKPLEVLLLEKTKSLQAENTGLKLANADVTGPSLLGMPGPFPPPLQTVETFGSILGEEIVASWQRTLSPDTNAAPTNADSPLPTTPTTTTITTTTPSPTNSVNGSGEGNSSTPVAANTPNGPTPEDAPSNIGGGSNATPPASSPLSTSTPHTPTATPLEAALAALEETKGPPPLQPASLQNGVAGGGGGDGPHAVPPNPTPTKEEPVKDPVEMATLERLQELLRHNIDKYANESLNTLNISRRVRELLSIHNIGQRLFAKYVLGLSQGTVSELLSKPKPWDKLTEKGRDSYRKMHAWACDDGGVFILKSLVPKKGKESGLPSFRQDDAATEERIALILNEAQLAMKNNHHHPHGHPHSPHPAHHHSQQPQPPPPHLEPEGCKPNTNNNEKADSLYYKESGNTIPRRLRKYENDDIPQEMVARIYQEELAKLMGKSPKELAMLGPPLDFPKDQYLRTQEEIRLALSVYHHELSKLTQHHHLVLQNGVQDLSLPKDRDRRHDSGGGGGGGGQHKGGGGGTRMVNGNDSTGAEQVGELERPRSGPRDGCCESPQRHLADNMRHAGSAFTLVRPKTEPGRSGSVTSPNPLLPLPEDSPTVCTAASPLQRMQSITNSLISQPSMPNMPSTPQRPLRAVLPPITQQQFDQYTNLNTEEIVKKVKEQLSQFSISQRLFGESVLGLSQGSVSDLLARPKPWHMLTQKGREPFIRMKIFLEDENAVHKLVASQYKIAPEKLMRTGSYGGSPPCSSKPHHPPKELDLLKAINPPGVHPITVNQVHLPQGPPCPDMASRAPTPDNNNLKKVVGPRAVPHLQPSVYEMAALTQDLDTQLITTKIKETLLANNIGQKIFGEAVLGLSQGSVSELLSKPKPWHMLSIKGREPFIRMQLWLNDPHNVDRLQALKNERREANKRRRSNIEYVEGTDSSESSYLHGGSTPLGQSPLGPAPKKPRVLFSEEQKEALRLAFALDPYPSTGTIEFLAQELRLTPRTITNWFHNHRMRLKQQGPPLARPGEEVNSACPPNGREGITFDPVQFRLLLNQRLLELQKEKGANTPLGPLGYPFYDDGSAPLSGLDLSLSAAHSTSIHVKQEDTENDSNVSSEYNEDSDASTTKDTMGAEGVPNNKSSSSRRKPAAPQWVNPGWEDMHTDDDEEEEEDSGASAANNRKSEVIINGVCVRQTEDFDLPSHTEETVRVEPAPAPDHEPDLEREEVEPVRSSSDDSDAPVPKERLHNIERLEKSLHEMDEGWDMLDDSEERKNNIDKLQQRIEKQDDDEEWEF